MKSVRRKEPESIYVQPDMVTTVNRLRWMGFQHRATVIPGTESRNSFQEVETNLMLIPQLLDEPPSPGTIE